MLNRKIILVLLFFFILCNFSPLTISEGKYDVSIIYVDNNYSETTDGWGINNFSSIQDAINSSVNGSTIYVFNGIYKDFVIINKSVKLLGENKEMTIIDSEKNIFNFKITVDNVNISNFTIRNCGIGIYFSNRNINNSFVWNNIITDNSNGIFLDDSVENIKILNNHFENNEDAIYLYKSSNNTISFNTILNQYANGIRIIETSNNNLIKNNTIVNNFKGISSMRWSNNNIIKNNNIFNNNLAGVYLDYCFHNIITKNNISLGGCGLKLSYSDYNTISFNNITKNKQCGIYLSESKNNNIFENFFYDNLEDIKQESEPPSIKINVFLAICFCISIVIIYILYKKWKKN